MISCLDQKSQDQVAGDIRFTTAILNGKVYEDEAILCVVAVEDLNPIEADDPAKLSKELENSDRYRQALSEMNGNRYPTLSDHGRDISDTLDPEAIFYVVPTYLDCKTSKNTAREMYQVLYSKDSPVETVTLSNYFGVINR